jgi:hypothetical protein
MTRALASLALLACTAPLPPKAVVSADPAFTFPERVALYRAYIALGEQSAGCVDLRLRFDGGPGFRVTRRDTDPGSNAHTYYWPGPRRTEVDPGRTGESGARTYAHEAGHALGYEQHSTDKRSFMFSPNTGELTFNAHDREWLKGLCE